MKKEIKWGSPKEYQSGWNKFVTRLGKRNRDYCKKLKGDHVYDFFEGHAYGWSFTDQEYSVWLVYRCIGCGKKALETYEMPLQQV